MTKASAIESKMAQAYKLWRAHEHEYYRLQRELQAVCPHDQGIGHFEGDDWCNRCRLIADTIEPRKVK